MKFPTNLSSGLLLALSIAIPSIFISTAAKAELVVNQVPSQVNRLETNVNLAPNVFQKLDGLRPGGLAGKDGFREKFRDSFKEKGKLDSFNRLIQPVAPASAVDTFRTLNNGR
jgi:hypothetical protein